MAGMKETTWETSSADDTIRVGREIAAALNLPKVLILRGGLGAGKTTLVKGIAEALDAADADEVTSPTFTLLHEYEGEREGAPVPLYHLDVYRLESERQLETVGWEELAGENSLVLIEWGEKFPVLVERADGEIVLESKDSESRKITLRLKC
jgi:tRNA threonylcarbamoyladenosine biosynthesis protein TsaE